ncbi:MAG TPA: glycoside hydrolase family 3 N-terminal domain-containing protein, partial [Bacteroidales bacterium]|nr:glycoside hydrolase family 3 N-terminal domain-containing protein [Bacteroidales bacterium]
AVTGPIKARPDQIEALKQGKIGSMLNVVGAVNTREMQKIVMENSRMKIPLIFGFDVIHGFKTIFPVPLGEASSWDMTAIEASARVAGSETAAAGVHWTFAPMVDIARDPRWGRIMEGAGEDPYLGSLIAVARVKGFQGKDLKDDNTVVACAKHFAAYGAAEGGRDYNTVDMSYRMLHEIYLRPFKAAADAGVGTFMNSFNEFDGVPATANQHFVNETLKGEWGFRGIVVSDWNSVGELIPHGVAKDKYEAAMLAANAGNDMDMEGYCYTEELAKLVKDGKVSEKTINEAVRRILRLKFKLGLFDDPYKYCNEEREKKEILSTENLNTARDVARKSIVLLSNKNQVLPLSTDVKSIAVIGPLGDSKKDMIGSWTAMGDANDAVTVLEGIKAQVSPATKILYSKGCNITGDSANITAAVSVARQADVVILAIGEAGNMSGEAHSRGNIHIPGRQEELAAEIFKTGKPVVVLLMNGRPVAIPWLAENAPSMLECWFLGTQAGNAIADVVFGKYNPSGKLTTSFPYSEGQIPIYYNHKGTGRPMTSEKDFYVSRYEDIPNKPVYPFGYGLSYTTFSYSDIQLSAKEIGMNDSLKISVDVKNTGKYDGEEVVQLYIRDLVGSVTRPVKELKGFRKLMIKAGETQKVTFTVSSADLAFYTKDMTFKAEPGEFKVFVGTSSEECKEAGFVLK